jgi:hypothetical protein
MRIMNSLKDEDKVRRAAEQVAQRVRDDYPRVKTEIDLDTVEVGDDAYVWITVDAPDLIDDVRAAACNYAGDFWEADDIFIVPRMRQAKHISHTRAHKASAVDRYALHRHYRDGPRTYHMGKRQASGRASRRRGRPCSSQPSGNDPETPF